MFWCYLIAVVIALVFAAIELALRFKAGNALRTVLIGWAQFWYYVSNVAFAVVALFFGKNSMGDHLAVSGGENFESSLAKCGLLVFGALLAARTSVGATPPTMSSPGSAGIGLGVVFGKFLSIIDERIEQKRFAASALKLKERKDAPSPKDVFDFVLPYCYAQSERKAGLAEQDVVAKCQPILESKKLSEQQKTFLMLTVLQKEFGDGCLDAAIQVLVRAGPSVDSPLESGSPLTTSSNAEVLSAQNLLIDKLLLNITQIK